MVAFVPSVSTGPAHSTLRHSSFICPPPPTSSLNHNRVARHANIVSPRRCPATQWTMTAEATETAEAPPAPPSETFAFQAEVSRVMNLIINSLYSNKEVFLRELVSNASDACDKKRFLSLNSGDPSSPSIYVKADKEAGVITIEDEGIGMTRQELISNLGSIATSGTSKFLDALGEGGSNDVSLIGQFGVGFYSSYLVSDRVQVVSKSYTDPKAKQYKWESTAESSFTITEDDGEPLKGGSGTRIILHVKDECKDFIDDFKLVGLMKRYSEFIQFPVYGWESKTEFDEVADGDEKDSDGKQKMKRVPRTEEDWSQVNKVKPIWMRRSKEVEQKEYDEFYKSIAKDMSLPVAHTHFAVEGDVEFRALLFCPKVLPAELRQSMFPDEGKTLKLYVKRVFISDNFDDLLPRWLCFIRGVVDSEDMPLNVSREILQKSKVLNTISKRLVRKTVDMFKNIKARDNGEYEEFWKQFGRYLKAGMIEGGDHVENLVKIGLWLSTNSPDKFTDLDGYISRMKENQASIYYVTAESRAAGENAPVMERLRKLGYEVLFMVEPVDELAVQNIASYKAKRTADATEETAFKFVDVSKDDLNLGELKSDVEKKEDADLKEDFKAVTEFMSALLAAKVGKVETSDKLTESASTITQSSFGISPTMERYMKEVGASNVADDPGMSSFMQKARTLEINPKHPIVKDIKLQLEGSAGGEQDDKLKQTCMLVYELGVLTSGFPLEDTSSFAKRVGSLLSTSVIAPEILVPPPEESPSVDDPKGMSMEDLEAQINAMKEKAPDQLSDEMLQKLDADAAKEAEANGEEALKPAGDEVEVEVEAKKVDGDEEIKSVKTEIVE